MKGRPCDELAQTTRTSPCHSFLRLQHIHFRRSCNTIQSLFSQFLPLSNRAWFGQLKAAFSTRLLIPQHAHAIFLSSPSSCSRAKARSVPLFHIYRHGGEFFEISFFDHLNIHSLTKTLNTTMFSSAFAIFTVFKAAFYPSKLQVQAVFSPFNRNQCTSYYFNVFRVLWSVTVIEFRREFGTEMY